jgi:predicted Holliday junction resolvase-like endonuclease
MIEIVKRWTIIALAILVAVAVLAIMAMRVETSSLRGQVQSLEQANQTLIDAATANAEAIKAKSKDTKSNDQLTVGKRAAVDAVRGQARRDQHAIQQALSTEACATVRLPDSAIRLLRPAGSDPSTSGDLESSSRPHP